MQVNILIVSYEDGITSEIINSVSKKYKNFCIHIAKNIVEAELLIAKNNYNLVIIDTMTPDDEEVISESVIPSINFVFLAKYYYAKNSKFIAIFDENETGQKGQEEMKKYGVSVISINSDLEEYLSDMF